MTVPLGLKYGGTRPPVPLVDTPLHNVNTAGSNEIVSSDDVDCKTGDVIKAGGDVTTICDGVDARDEINRRPYEVIWQTCSLEPSIHGEDRSTSYYNGKWRAYCLPKSDEFMSDER